MDEQEAPEAPSEFEGDATASHVTQNERDDLGVPGADAADESVSSGGAADGDGDGAAEPEDEFEKADERESFKALEEGVRSAFDAWTAIQLAITHSFGGPNTAQKVHALVEGILDRFTEPKVPDYDELCALMGDFLPQKLALVVEDGSIEQVSELILRMHDECSQGDIRWTMQYAQKHGKKKERTTTHRPRHEAESSTSAEDEAGAAKGGAEDDDGWNTVPTKKKRGRRR